MEDKCFCHLNGYAVKDATARQEIEELKKTGGVDETARAGVEEAKNLTLDVERSLAAHVQAEVVDQTARSAILSLEQKEVVDSTARTALTSHESRVSTLETANTDHESRLTTLESAGGGAIQELTIEEMKTYLANNAIDGKKVAVVYTGQVGSRSCIRFPIGVIYNKTIDVLYTFNNPNTIYIARLYVESSSFSLKYNEVKVVEGALTATETTIVSNSKNSSDLRQKIKFYIE